MFAGCILETSKDNLKALLGLVVLAQIVSILLDGKCQRALFVAAKSTDCVQTTDFSVTFFVLTHIFVQVTGSSKFERKAIGGWQLKHFMIVLTSCTIDLRKQKKSIKGGKNDECFCLFPKIFHSIFDIHLYGTFMILTCDQRNTASCLSSSPVPVVSAIYEPWWGIKRKTASCNSVRPFSLFS